MNPGCSPDSPSRCHSHTPGPKYFATALSHSADDVCFGRPPAYDVGPSRCLIEDLWVPLLLFASLTLSPADTKGMGLLTLPEETAAQMASCQPRNHRLKEESSFCARRRGCLQGLFQGRKKKALGDSAGEIA